MGATTTLKTPVSSKVKQSESASDDPSKIMVKSYAVVCVIVDAVSKVPDKVNVVPDVVRAKDPGFPLVPHSILGVE